jgi:hypothetical protein
VSIDAIYLATVWALPVIIAITFHQAAHGVIAHLLRLGRVSSNPLKHVDPFGTILLPGVLLLLHSAFMFGYAKPVPVNFRALRRPRRDMVLVAAMAGVVVPHERAEATAPVQVSDAPALNVCASTARRIEEIVARNRIRHEARLPLLSIPKELRRMKTVDDAAEFERFAAHHRQSAWEEVLEPVRKGWKDWDIKLGSANSCMNGS